MRVLRRRAWVMILVNSNGLTPIPDVFISSNVLSNGCKGLGVKIAKYLRCIMNKLKEKSKDISLRKGEIQKNIDENFENAKAKSALSVLTYSCPNVFLFASLINLNNLAHHIIPIVSSHLIFFALPLIIFRLCCPIYLPP